MAELTAVILTFLKAIGKYRWYAIIISWTVALIGWGVVFMLPNDYQASSRVYVDTQSVLKPLLSGMTTLPNLDQQVMFMRRTLISRPNVERVTRMVDIDVKAKNSKEKEKLIDDLIEKIKITGTERDDIYTITYNNPNPKLGKDVVQSLLTIFVEGSFGGKKQDSEKAVQFIDDQIKAYEEKLTAAENELKDFKIKNIGMLPRGTSDFSATMAEVSDRQNQAKLELAEAVQARNAIRRQIGGGDVPGKPSLMANPELDGRIQAVTKNLDALRMQYTDAHPDIIGAKRLLAQLEEKKREEARNRPASNDPGANYSPMLQQLKVSLSDAE
ncbi:MAG: XrtA system polysaccharide chain length determinant, partial [Massilia sp.]